MIRQIVARCHVGDSNRTVLRYVISRLRRGYATFAAMPRKTRRELIRAVFAEHASNRKLYRAVMTGRF